MKNLLKAIILFVILFLVTMHVNARNFYFSSSTGNDSYSITQAQNPATPWASLRKLTQLTTNGTVCFQAGDSILFKRGDVFANGSANGYCSAYWWNVQGDAYFTAPSGTPGNPIVISNYGDPLLPLPNWLYPSTTSPVSTWRSREGRAVIEFSGVHDIVVDGIQSNDYRFPVNDKITPGYTGGWILGEGTRSPAYGQPGCIGDTNLRKQFVRRFTLKNCNFSNCIYGIQDCFMWDSKITNCTFSNMKTSADTAGTHDILAGTVDGLCGINLEFSHNTVSGAWGKSGRIGSCSGLGGVGMDIFALQNSRIAYNTFTDCDGFIEVGNLDHNDTLSGAAYDTFAFNKIINCGQFAYIHGSAGDPFAGNNHHLAFWNNVSISNNKDRFIGWGFGKDVYGNGQGFAQGTPQPWWFLRNPYNTLNVAPMNPVVSTVQGSNVLTVSTNAGISLGSVWFTDDDDLASIAYKTVTVTAINGTSITVSDTATRTVSGYTNGKFYLPVSDQSWSNPDNGAWNNYSGAREVIQYAGDLYVHGNQFDTLFDCRNNIFYWTTGIQGVYDRNRFKRSSNLYIPLGGARYPTVLGGTLNYRGTGEILSNGSSVFVDTTAAHPDNWNLHLKAGSPAIGAGKPISGFTTDFDGNPLTNPPSIGLYNYTSSTPTCVFSYGAWNTCVNGLQSRSYASSPAGCSGLPPADSISRVCSSPCTSFTYTTWSTCNNGIQTRAYTGSPSGCVTTPPFDSIQRSCTTPCSFTYSAWSTCNGTSQTRTYSASPLGCVGTPPADSLTRSCSACVPPAVITYSAWSTCINNTQSRSYTKNPPDCGDIPPVDSIQRSCTALCTSFTYGSWSSCVNGIQSRSYSASPSGCIGTPPIDSIQRTCSIGCVFTYGAWTTCSGGRQTRSYSASPAGCTGTPPIDSTSRACSTTQLYLTVTTNRQTSCNNRSDGYIIVKATGGVGPYSYSINSTTNYTLNKTTFSGLGKATYTIRVKDSIGTIYTITVTVTSRRNRNC